MNLRLNPIALMLAALHAYIGVRLLQPFGLPVQAAGTLVIAACFWLLPKGWHVPEGGSAWSVLAPWVTMGFFSWLLVLTVARDVSVFAAAFFAAPDSLDAWIRDSAIGVMAATPL